MNLFIPRLLARYPLAALCLVFALALGSRVGSVALAQAPVQIKPVRLDGTLGEGCQDLRLAGTGLDRLVVAWVVSQGPEQGIYLQTRLNLLWSPAIRLINPENDDATQPRDLDLAFDLQGRLHLVWTAVTGGHRRVYIAWADDLTRPQATLHSQVIAVGEDLGDAADGEADFPTLTPDDNGGMMVVWQVSQRLCFSIRAVRVQADRSMIDLGLVSGKSLSGLSPQVLDPDDMQVAWCEVQDVGMNLRVDQWRPDMMRWTPSALERPLHAFDRSDQALLYPTDLGLVGCWVGGIEDEATTRSGGLEIGWMPRIDSDRPEAIEEPLYEHLGDAGGDVAYAGLSGQLGKRLTVAWQEFAEGRQRIRLASVFHTGEDAIQPVEVSGVDERFASLPDHLTIGDWSAVVWTDDFRDGGLGGVYFSEIHWSDGK